MEKTSLYTNSGELVTVVLVPPFALKPSVIIWGTRIFALDDKTSQYREAFAYCGFTEKELNNLGIGKN